MKVHVIRSCSTLNTAAEGLGSLHKSHTSIIHFVKTQICRRITPAASASCHERKQDRREAVDWALIYNGKLKLAMKPSGTSHAKPS